MCTIVLLDHVHPEFPVVIAANRDEFYARACRAPAPLADRPTTVAGIDLVGGGSWMGVNQRGLLVGLTNQRSYGVGHDPARTSRGTVVLDALAAPDVAAVAELVGGLDPDRYNPFNLVFGDADGLTVAYSRPGAGAVELQPVPRGVSVLPNDRLDSPEFAKAGRARDAARAIADAPWPELVPGLRAILADHWRPPLSEVPAPPPGALFDRTIVRELQAMCVHTPVYGTRSATLIALAAGRVAHYLYADGPPCTADFVEVAL